MLNLLFNSNALYDVLLTILLIGLVILMVKSKSFRVFSLTIILVIFIGLSTVAGFHINNYYTASGGVIGEISQIIKPSIEIQDASFEMKNIALVETGKQNEYGATIIVKDIVNLPEGNREIFVNNEPTNIVSSANDYVSAYYNYIFYNSDLKELANDQLYIKISFYTNSTLIMVSTTGGENAVKYWNYYFNNNNFIITIK